MKLFAFQPPGASATKLTSISRIKPQIMPANLSATTHHSLSWDANKTVEAQKLLVQGDEKTDLMVFAFAHIPHQTGEA
jgi:hypothetical protein